MNNSVHTEEVLHLKAEVGTHKAEQPGQAQRLLEFSKNCELFRTPDGDCYATIPVNGHREVWAIESSDFRNWLTGQYYRFSRKAPEERVLKQAVSTLVARAQFDGKTAPVFLRIGSAGGKVYLDLVNDAWEVVEIGPDGWRILTESPVYFRRSKKMKALPRPEKGSGPADIELLRPFFNVESGEDFKLLIAFVINCFNPAGPYLVLVLYGEQGSSKSTTVKTLRCLVDPNEAPLRKEPRQSDDLMVSAIHNWVVAIDNMSHLPEWLSDDFCRLANGAGLSKRKHYSNDEEIVLDAKRPIILNGISEFVARGDLASRAIMLNLPAISGEKRRREVEYWSEFEKVYPRVLGRILSAVSAALRNEKAVRLDTQLRMADAWHWVTASEDAFGWDRGSMVAAFKDNLEAANETVLNSSLIYTYIRDLAELNWSGSASDLLSKLNSMAPALIYEGGWPRRARGLTDQLRRLNPALRSAGFVVEFWKTTGSNSERRITIRKSSDLRAATAATSQNSEGSDSCDPRDAEIQALASEQFDFNGPYHFPNRK